MTTTVARSEVITMSNLIRNNTSSLHRTINVRVPKGGTTSATIERIGPPSVGHDGRMWSMVYGTTLGGTPLAFAAVNDGPPKWGVQRTDHRVR